MENSEYRLLLVEIASHIANGSIKPLLFNLITGRGKYYALLKLKLEIDWAESGFLIINYNGFPKDLI